jgi:hypothetical protein
LLALLRDICKGKVHSTEVKIQYLFSFEDIMTQIQDPFTYLELKNALMEFMDEVYLYTEKTNPTVSGNAQFWNVINGIVVDIENFIKEKFPKLNDNTYIFSTSVAFLRNYFQIHYDKAYATPMDIVEKVVKTYIRLSKSTANPKHKRRINELLNVIDERIPNEFTKGFLSTSKENGESFVELRDREEIKTGNNLDQDDEIKIDILTNFISRTKEIILSEVDISKFYKRTIFVEKHEKESDSFFSNIFSQNGKKVKKEEFTNFVPNLIQLLQNILLLENYSEYIEVIIKAVKSVQSIMLNEQKIGEHNFTRIQNKMSMAGAGKLVVDLLQSPNEEIFSESLKLGVLLLDDGNSLVQKEMNERFKFEFHFYSHLFRSNKGVLFIKLKERIRDAMGSMKERKSYMARKKARLEGFLGSQIQKGRYKISQLVFVDNEEFRGVNFIETLLRFLQLLCEGHNLENQKYLNTQPEIQKSINLVDETLAFTLRLKKYIDYTNVDSAIQAFETLTEYVQGPCVENQILLNQSSLYEMANDILESEYSAFYLVKGEKRKEKSNNLRLDPLITKKEKQYIFNIVDKLDENDDSKILRHKDMITLKQKLMTTLIR